MLSGAMLTELDLSDNAFGPVGAEALVPLLSSPCCFSLKVSVFSWNVSVFHSCLYVGDKPDLDSSFGTQRCPWL